jgi:hypothetical protein
LEKVVLVQRQEGFILSVEFKVTSDAERKMIINVALEGT